MEGIRLCGCTLIPGLFPFFFVTGLLGQRLSAGKGGSLTALLMSFLGGYPTGVVTTVAMYKKGGLTKREAQALLPLCNNSGPGFFVGVLGATVFRDPKKGLLLYGIHVAAALLLYVMLYGEAPSAAHREAQTPGPFSGRFLQVLGNSCETMLRVCGLVILFSVLGRLIRPLLPGQWMKYWALVELSSGVLSTGPHDAVLWAMFMGWGGLCVHLQAMSIWQEAGLKVRGYLPVKALHGLLSGLFAMAVYGGRWEIVWFIFVLWGVFMVFRKKWGSKKQDLAL